MKNLEQLMLDRWNSGEFSQVAKEACQSPDAIAELFELNKHENPKVAWRSAYVIDMIHDLKPQMVTPYLEYMAAKVPEVQNHSIKRHYLRILAQHDLSELADGKLVDSCFEWLLIRDIPIAVKAHCMTILFNLTQTYPELAPELKTVLEQLIPYGSAGEKNRANKILGQMKKLKLT